MRARRGEVVALDCNEINRPAGSAAFDFSMMHLDKMINNLEFLAQNAIPASGSKRAHAVLQVKKENDQ